MRLLWIRYSAFIVLVTLALLFNVMHAHGEWLVEQYPQHQVPWLAEWYRGTFENLQSEVWQVWLAAAVWAGLRWKGTPESKEVA